MFILCFFEAATELAKPLTVLFQKSLLEGKLPANWKKANITPENYKEGQRHEVGNYNQSH